MRYVKNKSFWKLQGRPARIACTLFALCLSACLCSCANIQSKVAQQNSEETKIQEVNAQELITGNNEESEEGEAAELNEGLTESNDGSAESDTDEADAMNSDEVSSKGGSQELITIEDLPTTEEAEKETSILAADEGTTYAEGEVLVRLPKKVPIIEINIELGRLGFIEEDIFSEGMLISGEIQDSTVVYGAIGESVMKIHTADGANVPQAIMVLQRSTVFLNPQPNYFMTASL
jgi:hypothetical protein